MSNQSLLNRLFVTCTLVNNSKVIDWQVVLAFLLVYLIWGSTYLFIFFSIQTIPPLIMGSIRFLVVGVVLIGWTVMVKKEIYTKELWVFGIVSGFLLFLVGSGAVILAEKHLPSGLVSILAGTVPFWILILDKNAGAARFKNGLTWLGLAFGFGGLVILFYDKVELGKTTPAVLWSYMLMIIGALAWTWGTLYSKYTSIQASTYSKVAVQTFTSGLMFLAVSLFNHDWNGFNLKSVSAISWWSLAYLIVFGSMVGYFCFLWLLSKVSAHAVSTYAFVNPMVAVVLGVLFAGEHFDSKEYIALIFVIGGLISLYLSKKYM